MASEGFQSFKRIPISVHFHEAHICVACLRETLHKIGVTFTLFVIANNEK